jgi:hypothetical protein
LAVVFAGAGCAVAGSVFFMLTAGVFESSVDGLAFCCGVTLRLGKSCGGAPCLCSAAGSVSPPEFIHAAQPPSRARAL